MRIALPYAWHAASGTWRAVDPVPPSTAFAIAVRIVDPLGRASTPTNSNVIQSGG